MSTLSVWTFPTADAADHAKATITQLVKAEPIELQDTAVVSWPEGRSKPKTRQLLSLGGVGTAAGGFWGLLFGLLFCAPFIGIVVGAALGWGVLHDAAVGIDDRFIQQVRAGLRPGTSALFVLTSAPVAGTVGDRFKGAGAELVAASA